jgi:hypothetical protein
VKGKQLYSVQSEPCRHARGICCDSEEEKEDDADDRLSELGDQSVPAPPPLPVALSHVAAASQARESDW